MLGGAEDVWQIWIVSLIFDKGEFAGRGKGKGERGGVEGGT